MSYKCCSDAITFKENLRHTVTMFVCYLTVLPAELR